MSQLSIGYITPWDVEHGIAAYSRSLILALRPEIQPRVVGFELDDDGQADIDPDSVLEHLESCRIIHIQFDKALYDRTLLENLLKKFQDRKQKVVLTAHNLDIWLGFPQYLVDRWILHHFGDETYRMDNLTVIPMGIKFYSNGAEPVSVRSVCCFGRKSHPNAVEAALDNIGGGVLSVIGESEWLDDEELSQRLLRSQVIVLNYEPTDSKQFSKAAILAAGVKRPIVISDIPEFTHVRDLPGVAVAADSGRIGICLDYTFANYPEAMKYTEDRRLYCRSKRLTFQHFCEAHLQLYTQILAQ